MSRLSKDAKIFRYARKRILDHKVQTDCVGHLRDEDLIGEISDKLFDMPAPEKGSRAWRKMEKNIGKARDSVRKKKTYLQKQESSWASVVQCSESIMGQLITEGLIESLEDAKCLNMIFYNLTLELPSIALNIGEIMYDLKTSTAKRSKAMATGNPHKSDKFFQYARKRILDYKIKTNWRGYISDKVIMKEISDNLFAGVRLTRGSEAWKNLRRTIDLARESVRNRRKYMKKQIVEWAPMIKCSGSLMEQLIAEELVRNVDDVKRLSRVLSVMRFELPSIGVKNHEKQMLSRIMKTLR